MSSSHLAGPQAGSANDAHAHEAQRDADVVQPVQACKPASNQSGPDGTGLTGTQGQQQGQGLGPKLRHTESMRRIIKPQETKRAAAQ